MAIKPQINQRRIMIDEDIMRQLDDAIVDGVCEGTCNKCDYSQDVEPDAYFPCPECKDGKVASILIKYGLI